MKKPFFIFTILVFVTSAFSQQKFIKGYILKTEKDTLLGWINNTDEHLKHTECLFKTTKTSEAQHFQPSEIYGYRLADGEYFISKQIEVGDTITNLFLEYLSSGAINLLHYKDEMSNEHYYIEKTDKPLIEISNTTRPIEVSGKYYTNPVLINRNALKYYLESCPELFPKIDEMTSCISSKLISLLLEYNNCTQSKEPFVKHATRTKKEFHVEIEGLAGVKKELKFFDNKVVGTFGGINIYFMLPIITRNAKIYLKTGYNICHYKSVYLTENATDPIYIAMFGYYYQKLYPEYNLLSIPIQLQVLFGNKKLKPLASFGINLYKDYFMPCINLGCNYSLTKNLSATLNIDIETETPLSPSNNNTSSTTGLASSSANIGLRYRF